jgi:hypothetical protein
MNPLDLLDQCTFWYYRSFRARFYVEPTLAEELENGLNTRTFQRIEEISSVNVGSVNLCEISNAKIDQLASIIERYELDIIWLIDLRKAFKGFKGYTTIYTDDPLQNQLLIRNSLYRNGEVLKTEYGLSYMGINFRYIRPNTKTTSINWTNEIGDYNWTSNKWIKIDATTEVRNGIPGGMLTNLENPKFIKFRGSDHKMIIGTFKCQWKPNLEMNYYDLEKAINEAGESAQWKNIYSRVKTRIQESKEMLGNKRKTSKIVDIKKLNLDLTPWKLLYRHEEQKKSSWFCQFTDFTRLDNTKSKAKDINEIKVQDAIRIFNKLNVKQKNNLMIAWKSLKRETRAIALRKKDVMVKKVTDTRLIQIYPANMKIQEYSRVKLKMWLEKQSKPSQYGFVKDRSTMNLIEDLGKLLKIS